MSMYKRDMYIAYILFSAPRADPSRRNNQPGRHQYNRPREVTPEQFAVSSYLCGRFVRDRKKIHFLDGTFRGELRHSGV